MEVKMSEKYSEVGNRLGYIRTVKLNKTQEVMAEHLGVSVEFYRLLEKGRFLPGIEALQLLHDLYADIDFILIGKKAEDSQFEEPFKGISEDRRQNICNLVIFKMRQLLDQTEGNIVRDGNGNRVRRIPLTAVLEENRENITPDIRMQNILIDEYHQSVAGNRKISNEKVRYAFIARVFNKSLRTVSRWLNGTNPLRIDMVMSVYEKYGYAPSYILFGEFNSNSKMDYYYRMLGQKEQEMIREFVEILVKYL